MTQPRTTRVPSRWHDAVVGLAIGMYLAFFVRVLAGTRRGRVARWVRHLPRRTDLKVRRLVPLRDVFHDEGHCFMCFIDPGIPAGGEGVSRVRVYEDGQPLTPHRDFEAVRDEGLGRFTHPCGRVHFAVSDNTDPTANGRTYSFQEI